VLGKVEAVLPDADRHRIADTALFALSFWVPEHHQQMLGTVRKAIDDRRRLHIVYQSNDGDVTQRVIRPLGLYFWGRMWTVAAWCELRQDHRTFRVDRIEEAAPLDDHFSLAPPVTLDDYLAQID
jgi:predicted DNA-binding transcriptional regulator YafY